MKGGMGWGGGKAMTRYHVQLSLMGQSQQCVRVRVRVRVRVVSVCERQVVVCVRARWADGRL